MKKTLIAVAAAAALAASSAFAEVTFGTWLRTVTGVAYDGDDAVMGMSNSWGGMRPSQLNATWTSEDEKAGMKMELRYDGEGMDMGDNQYVWVKPIDQFKLSLGNFGGGETGLRGDLSYGSWAWLRPGNWVYDDEGLTFDGTHAQGLMAHIYPVEGLTVVVNLPVKESAWNGNTAESVFRNGAYMAMYEIESVGRIKAGFFGDYKEGNDTKAAAAKWTDKDGKDVATPVSINASTLASIATGELVYVPEVKAKKGYETTGTIGVAFDLTAVENLYVTIGARFGIADKEWRDSDGKSYLKASVALGASYQVTDELKVSASGAFKMYQDKCVGKESDPDDKEFGFGVGVDYAIMDGLAASADVRFINTGHGKDGDDNSISFLVGVNKSVSSNGSLGIGFQGATNGNGLAGVSASEKDGFVWAIPVALSVYF